MVVHSLLTGSISADEIPEWALLDDVQPDLPDTAAAGTEELHRAVDGPEDTDWGAALDPHGNAATCSGARATVQGLPSTATVNQALSAKPVICTEPGAADSFPTLSTVTNCSPS